MLQTRADMAVLVWAVILGLDSYVCAQWVVVVPFVKTVSGFYFLIERGFILAGKYELSLSKRKISYTTSWPFSDHNAILN